MPSLDLLPLLESFSIRDKAARIVPFKPNWAQRQVVSRVEKDYAEGRPTRLIILKARQLGISTITQGILLSMSVLFKNLQAAVVAHRSDAAEYLFSIGKTMFESWPFAQSFPVKYSTRRELTLSTQNSSIKVHTADKPDVGRTVARTFLHASELAMWRLPMETMIGFAQSIPDIPGTAIFVESTAKGVGNLFEEMWNDATAGISEYTPLFFPWFLHYEYIPCGGMGCETGTCEICERESKGIKPQDTEEKRLAKLGATPAHIAWRRKALPTKFYGDEDFFRQEMPATPEEAFLSEGVNAFRPDLLQQCFVPLRPQNGRLVRNKQSGGVDFVEDSQGPLRLYKRPSSNEGYGKYFIGADPCQPPGTLVRKVVARSQFEDVPIEDIREGDKVLSFKMGGPNAAIYRHGRRVMEVKKREYDNKLVTVETPQSRTSRYTEEHKCVVRLNGSLDEGNYIVYMQRRGDDFRIGRTMWKLPGGNRVHGLHRRADRQGADAAWVLSVHDTEEDAALDEAVLSSLHNIPTCQFRSEGQATVMPLDRFWEKMGGNVASASRCLKQCDRDIRFPLWEKGTWYTREPVLVRAINLMSGMEVLQPDEIAPGKAGMLRTRRATGGWVPVVVDREWYEGPVYSLDVDEDHTYVADGIVTHNCHGTSDGDFAAAQVINRHTKEQVAVWHARINPVPFADELAKLGEFFNWAIVSPDIMGGGAATLGALTHLYPNIWEHRSPDKWPGKDRSRALGFLGSWQRKQWMIAKLADYVERDQMVLHDTQTYKEMRAYVFYGSKGWGDVFGPATRDGHDDLVCALAIAVLCESTEDPVRPYEVASEPPNIPPLRRTGTDDDGFEPFHDG